MFLKVIAGVVVAAAVVLTSAAMMGYHGQCPFSSCCSETPASAPETDSYTPAQDCCETASPSCCDAKTEQGATCPVSATATKAKCCQEESKVAGEEK